VTTTQEYDGVGMVEDVLVTRNSPYFATHGQMLSYFLLVLIMSIHEMRFRKNFEGHEMHALSPRFLLSVTLSAILGLRDDWNCV